jgi:GWxTD domain-containing protein
MVRVRNDPIETGLLLTLATGRSRIEPPFGEKGCSMRVKTLVFLICFFFAWGFAPSAEAQLSEEYASWADGPAGFLLTKKEKKAWSKITSDPEAEQFIELFWARRNPDPTSTFNPFKAEFDAKVRYSEKNFSYGSHSGATSDRAKVLILMGKPEAVHVRAASSSVPGIDNPTATADAVEGQTQIWVYDPAKLPDGLKVRGSQLFFMFYEQQLNSNNFILDRSAREAFKGVSALSDAPEVYLLHPNLKEVPKPVSIEGGSPASAAHLAWLDGGDAPYNDIAKVIAELGVSDSVHRPLWIHIELPPDAPTLDLIAGRVTGADGEVVSNFEIAATPLAGQYGKSYHLAFALEEGSYTIDVVGAADSEPQVVASFTEEISTVPEEGTWMSPLWLGSSVTANPEAKLGDAFTIGGWHVMPISGPEMTRAAEITYFGFIVRPALNDDGTVNLRARVHVKQDGKELGKPLDVPLEPSQMMDDLYMYGNSIGLSGIPELGEYEFVFEITETNSDTSAERSVVVDITE